MDCIIYPTDEGGVAVVLPVPGNGLSTAETAAAAVPAGYPYWIIDQSALPSSRAERNDWAIDQETAGEPHGYGGQL